MELHMVHQSSDPNGKNKIAVVGQLYTIGKPDPFLAQVNHLQTQQNNPIQMARL